VFEAIYNKRNLTHAADLLCVTQPAVSNALARMRKAFDDPLFISSSQGMIPTPLAESMYGQVGEALHLLNTAVRQGDRFEPSTAKQVFRVSMPDLAEALLLPVLGEALQEEAPGVRIESYYTNRSEISHELATGAVHLAIDVPLIDDPMLLHTPLSADRYACLLRRDHPFQGERLTIEDYLALSHIHVSSRKRGAGHVDSYLGKIGRKRAIQMRVQHYMVAPLIAMRTDLALTAPVSLLQRYDGCILELPFAVSPVEWHCYWHRSLDHDEANRWLRDKFIATMRSAQSLPRR
jgi:DNA-binding transcriptional LysR family regulator